MNNIREDMLEKGVTENDAKEWNREISCAVATPKCRDMLTEEEGLIYLFKVWFSKIFKYTAFLNIFVVIMILTLKNIMCMFMILFYLLYSAYFPNNEILRRLA
jgi:hypothetical protein